MKPWENYHLLPFGRPLTPEQIYEDILLAMSQDTGLPVEALKSGRTELTPEELRAWQIAHGFVGPEGK